MALRALVIDDEALDRAAKIVAYAEAHPWHTRAPGSFPPGAIPEHVGMFGSFRAVFSMTHEDGLIFRHVSISVPGEKLPNPIACFVIAGLFGLTGWSEDMGMTPPPAWALNVDREERVVAIVQLIGSDVPASERN